MEVLRRTYVFRDRFPAFSDVFHACHDLHCCGTAPRRGKWSLLAMSYILTQRRPHSCNKQYHSPFSSVVAGTRFLVNCFIFYRHYCSLSGKRDLSAACRKGILPRQAEHGQCWRASQSHYCKRPCVTSCPLTSSHLLIRPAHKAGSDTADSSQFCVSGKTEPSISHQLGQTAGHLGGVATARRSPGCACCSRHWYWRSFW